MIVENTFKITIIGSGNVATHLARRLYECDISIEYIISRNYETGPKLAKNVEAQHFGSLAILNDETDIYIIAVSDDAIEHIAKRIPLGDRILVHTSGSIPMDLLKYAGNNYGCFYPLQTFSKDVEIVNFKEIPILISASNLKTGKILYSFAEMISANVRVIDDEQRQKLHLAAVFVNNFTNHIFSLTSEYLKRNHLDFSLLEPLIKETINKAMNNKPKDVQTGPAIRKDENTIKRHLRLMKKDSNLQSIYKAMTKSIRVFFND